MRPPRDRAAVRAPSVLAARSPAAMEALLVSTGVVAIGEIGDKTQLLSLVLAARFRRPWPIVAGIFVATLANHALAGWIGNWVRGAVPADVLRWILAASFFAVALWALKPDTLDEDDAAVPKGWGVFGVTVVAFFLAEMGDKTQIATIAMAAHYANPVWVVLGTTLGMLIADVPAVFVGDKLAARIPMKLVHAMAAAIFALLGIATLLGAGAGFGL